MSTGSRAGGVACALAVARVAALAGHTVVWSWWSPIAYLWQDAAVVLIYLAVDRALGTAAARIACAAVVSYIAIGVPVVRVMSTPMTWTMWRAAGGALSDSVWMYATWRNLVWSGITLAAASVPSVVSSFSRTRVVASSGPACGPAKAGHYRYPAAVSLVAVAALGPTARTHVDTHGLDRNAWSALAIGLTPRVAATAATTDWRRGRTWRPPREDLSALHGIGRNRSVILVSLESTAAQYLALYGAADDPTPILSRLARSAVVFENAYAAYPESIKGLFSMLCSVYPAIDIPAETLAATPCRSLAERLGNGGYRTALFHSGRFEYLGMEAVVRDRGYEILADAGDIGGNHESSFGVDDRATVARILRWIDSLPHGSRFFVTYLPVAGHHPYETAEPGPFPGNDEIGRYRNALHYGDAALGDLVRGLELRGLDRETLWLVAGDHGEAFGQHDGNFGHTFQLYEENVHVPFLIAAPGAIAGTIRTDRIVSLVDAAPTVLDALDLPAETSYEGRSALQADSGMALFLADYSLGFLGLRDGAMKCIYEIESGRARLFDVARDPQESLDIAGDHREETRWYVERLRSWSAGERARRTRR